MTEDTRPGGCRTSLTGGLHVAARDDNIVSIELDGSACPYCDDMCSDDLCVGAGQHSGDAPPKSCMSVSPVSCVHPGREAGTAAGGTEACSPSTLEVVPSGNRPGQASRQAPLRLIQPTPSRPTPLQDVCCFALTERRPNSSGWGRLTVAGRVTRCLVAPALVSRRASPQHLRIPAMEEVMRRYHAGARTLHESGRDTAFTDTPP